MVITIGVVMKLEAQISTLLQRMVADANWRFAIGVRIRFTNPTLLYQTYPDQWLNYYDSNALLFNDPTIKWGLTSSGIADWVDLADNDDAGVLAKAAEYGLKYGFGVSVGDASQRTLGFFAREETPFTDEEKAHAEGFIVQLHDLTEGVVDLPEDAQDDLRLLNDGLAKYRI